MTSDKSTALAKLDGIEALLIVPEGEVLAVASPETSLALFTGTSYEHFAADGRTRSADFMDVTTGHYRTPAYSLLVGETYFGMYGSFGHVELKRAPEPTLQGVIYVSRQALRAIEFRLDDDAAYEAFFRQFFIEENKKEKLQAKMQEFRAQKTGVDEELRAAMPFLDKEYNWKIVTEPVDIFASDRKTLELYHRTLDEQVAECAEAVKSFIIRLDAYIHSLDPRAAGTEITPEYAAQRYASMTEGRAIVSGQNVKLLGSGG